MTNIPHGGIKIGDIVAWAGERCRVTGVYDGCDEIVIEQLEEPGGFDVLWWSVQPTIEAEYDGNDDQTPECPNNCADKAPAGEYWVCPVCDAEWFPENETESD